MKYSTHYVVIIICLVILALAIAVNKRAFGVYEGNDILVTNIATIPNQQLPPLQRQRLLTERLIDLAAVKANKRWNGTRCTKITYDYRHLADKRIAEAKWFSQARDSRWFFDCSITFNTDPRKIRTTFWHYCAAVIHEYGHLSGFYEKSGPNKGMHSSQRNSVMYPVLTEQNIPKVCKTTYVAPNKRYIEPLIVP